MTKLTTKIIIAAITIVVLISVAGWLWVSVNLSAPEDESRLVDFTVVSGSSVETIASNLKQDNIIRNSTAFTLYVRWQGLSAQIQAGDYQLDASQDADVIARALSSGEALTNEIAITIPEGLSNAELSELLAQEFADFSETFSDTDKNQAILTGSFINELQRTMPPQLSNQPLDSRYFDLKPSENTLEGFFFPDTYRFFKDATPTEVAVRMLSNFNLQIDDELQAQIEASERTFYEILVMASILEKELITSEDRRIAADLFWRRLDIGMALQSDATVNYVTGKSELRPSFDDLETTSPYNTYQNVGLPPGPICNPGLDAIEAALNPTPNDFFYYLTDSDNITRWGRNLEEHNDNRLKYLE
ncbi:MAG: endolytic transglycosylase MltG [Patescibacteria group bacterium]